MSGSDGNLQVLKDDDALLRQPGSEIQSPMAVVILFGLASSTLLNMLVVPALYLRFGAIRQELESGQTWRRRTSDVLDEA